MTDKFNHRFGIMSVAILMAFLSLLTGAKGSPYTVFWIYTAYLSYKGDIKTLKPYLIVLIWINAIIMLGVLLFVDLRTLQWVMPDAESHLAFLLATGIPLAIKVAVLIRINSLIAAERVDMQAITEKSVSYDFSRKNRRPSEAITSKKIEGTEDGCNKIPLQRQEKIDATSFNDAQKSTVFAETNSKTNEPKPIINQPSITDWELAFDEYNGSKRNNGLWAKIFAENNGNENSTKAQYLKIRAAEISRQRMADECGTEYNSKK